MASLHVLAIDMGSSAIRAILGTWERNTLVRREILRVPHQVSGTDLCWNLDAISSAARNAVMKALKILGRLPDGVGVCGWGVDFVGVDSANSPVTPARAYRGSHGARGRAALTMSDWEAFTLSGVYPQDINSIYQLAGLQLADARWFSNSQHIEFLPDWTARDLATASYGSFTKRHEVPPWTSLGVGSTAGFISADRKAIVGPWESIGLSPAIVPPIAPELTIAAERGRMAIIRAGSHDTACAAHSLGSGYAGLFISCGSWAVAGAITPNPVVTKEAFAAGVTNEAAAAGKNRAQVNLTGMWLVQECRREWGRQGWNPSYAELNALTFAAAVPDGVLDVGHPDLVSPGDMPKKITRLAARQLGVKAETPGEILALAHRSVAAASARAIQNLRRICGANGDVAIVGGGVRDPYLIQAMKDELGEIIIGDPEASALGNLTAQLITLGVPEQKLAAWRQARERRVQTSAEMDAGVIA
ncbi:FGGY-family carbohydrate kinase [Arcanobacterium hippocoleae]